MGFRRHAGERAVRARAASVAADAAQRVEAARRACGGNGRGRDGGGRGGGGNAGGGGGPDRIGRGSIVSNCVALRCVAHRIASSRARDRDQSPARPSWADLKRADPAKPGARMRRRPPRRMPAGGPASAQIAAARGCRSRADEPAPARRRRTTRRNHRADRLIHVVSCIQTPDICIDALSRPRETPTSGATETPVERNTPRHAPCKRRCACNYSFECTDRSENFPSPPLAQRAPNLRR